MLEEINALYNSAYQELQDYRTLVHTQKALSPDTPTQVQQDLDALIARTRQSYNEQYLLWHYQLLTSRQEPDTSLPNLL